MTGVEITEVLGNLGDFIGAIAVFGTIVYLAIQVRHSKEATEANTAAVEEQRKAIAAQTTTDVLLYFANWNGQIATSSELRRIEASVFTAEDPAAWSREEYQEARAFLMAGSIPFACQYMNASIGVAEEEMTRTTLRDFKGILESSPAYQLFWEREQDQFPEGFREALAVIEDATAPSFTSGPSHAAPSDRADA